MQTNQRIEAGGVSIAGLLGITFIVLKLCGVITWSWWWVTSPFWFPIALFIVIFIISLIIAVLHGAIDTYKERREEK